MSQTQSASSLYIPLSCYPGNSRTVSNTNFVPWQEILMLLESNWLVGRKASYRLPRWLSGKESTLQCRRHRFDPWAGKMPWRRKWQPTPVFLPGKSHGQRRPMAYSSGGHKTVRRNLATKQQQQLVTLVNLTNAVTSPADWVSASLQSLNCSQGLGSTLGSSHFLCGLSSPLVLKFLLRGRGSFLRAKPSGWILPPTCLPSDPVILPLPQLL